MVRPRFDVGLTGALRHYGSSDAETENPAKPLSALADEQVLLDLGVAASWRLSPTAQLRGGFTSTRATGEETEASPFSGTHTSAGLRVGF